MKSGKNILRLQIFKRVLIFCPPHKQQCALQLLRIESFDFSISPICARIGEKFEFLAEVGLMLDSNNLATICGKRFASISLNRVASP